MKTEYTAALAVVAGFGLGAVAVESLHAQAKPPVYYIAEIDVTNQEGYVKEYVPKVQATIKASGGRILAAGGKVTPIEGAPPKPRVVPGAIRRNTRKTGKSATSTRNSVLTPSKPYRSSQDR